jgi:hypothetical protein
MQLLAQADNFIQMTTATFDPSLGRISQQEKSGRAIMALQQQSDSAQSNYLQNLADVSMVYEAKVVLDVLPVIYGRPGRIARILDEEGESETIILNQPYYTEPQTKRPVPLRPGQQPPMPPGPPQGPAGPPGPGPMPGGSPPMPAPKRPEVKHYDLSKGIYSVAVNIGKQKQTAMQEGAEMIGQILQSRPELMPILGPTWMKYQSWPGARELADLLTKMRDKQFPGLVGGEDGQPSPAQVQQQMEQMGQQMQMMQAQLQAAVQKLETDFVKSQAALQKAEMEQQAMLQKAQMDNAAKVEVARTQAQSDQTLAELKAQLEGIKAMLQSREAEADREHEAALTVAEAALEPPSLEYTGPAETPILEAE